MSTIKEIRTFLDLQNAIIGRAKAEDKTSVRDSIKEKINTAYQFVGFEEPYRWSGITTPLTLPAKYTTGTAALVNGSDLVTGTSTSWTQFLHEGNKFYVTGVNRAFKILRVSESDQVITLDTPWTGESNATATYTIFKDEYGLFPDFKGLRRVSLPGQISYRQPTPCGPNEMDYFRSSNTFRGGLPVRYTISGYNTYTSKTWTTFNINTDFWEDDFGSVPRNHNLILWPCMPTASAVAMVRYTKLMDPMVNDTDEPIMPYEVRPRLVYEVLIDHFITNRDSATKREWKEKRDELKRMMAAEIETTDDELILTIDRGRYSRFPSYGLDNFTDNDS